MKFKSINVADDNPYYIVENGVLFSADHETLVYYPSGRNDLTEYYVPDGVIAISNGAFNNSSFKNIYLPYGI